MITEIISISVSIIAVIVSIVSLIQSYKVNKVQMNVNILEEKIKKYELDEKERNLKAKVQARILKISQGKYVLRIFNASKATAYNVDFKVEEGYKLYILKDKTPYEFLEPDSSYEEHILASMDSDRKAPIITIWEDEQGNKHEYKQLCSL